MSKSIYPTEGLTWLGRMTAGPMLASANLAAQAFQVGVRAGAGVAGTAAAAAEAAVPGAGLARKMAERIGEEAAAGAQEAAHRASLCQGHGAQHDASWIKLAADTAAGPLARLAALSAELSADAVKAAVSTRPGQRMLETALERAQTLAGNDSVRIDIDEQRESVIVVMTDSGATLILSASSLAEAALRLAFFDTAGLHRAIEGGLEDMHLLAASDEMHELLPVPVVSAELRERARNVVERTPKRFLAALEESAQEPSPRAILEAALADADHLRLFAIGYPRTVLLMTTSVGKLLAAGSLQFHEMEAFMQGRERAGASAS